MAKKYNPNINSAKEIHEKFWENCPNIIKEKGPVSRHLQRILLSLIKDLEFKSVLDVGCGQGAIIKVLQKYSPHSQYFGTDISEKAIKKARNYFPEANYSVQNIEKEYLDKIFDLVICLDVVEHTQNDLKALKNIRKMVGKYFVLSTIQGRMRSYEGPEGHVRNYKYNELMGKLSKSGFKVLKVIKWGFPFYSPICRDLVGLMFKYRDWSNKNLLRRTLLLRNKQHTTGTKDKIIGISQKILFWFAEPIYQIMRLNSHSHGDHLFILAEPS